MEIQEAYAICYGFVETGGGVPGGLSACLNSGGIIFVPCIMCWGGFCMPRSTSGGGPAFIAATASGGGGMAASSSGVGWRTSSWITKGGGEGFMGAGCGLLAIAGAGCVALSAAARSTSSSVVFAGAADASGGAVVFSGRGGVAMEAGSEGIAPSLPRLPQRHPAAMTPTRIASTAGQSSGWMEEDSFTT